MLLLVLILVVLAFGLLVFALQAGSVIAAWVSVGLSVAAALVLLVDWLQRRSAMRAGAASLEAAGERPPPREREYQHDPEPATEVLPVIPPSGPVPVQGAGPGAGDEPTMVAARPAGQASDEDADTTMAGDAPAEGEDEGAKTILMPAVQPSGSSSGPSGATQGFTGSSGSSSPSVTKSGAQAEDDDRSEDDQAPAAETSAAATGSAGGGDATVAVDTRKRPVEPKVADAPAAGAADSGRTGTEDTEKASAGVTASAGVEDGSVADGSTSSDAAAGDSTRRMSGGIAAGAAAAAAGAAAATSAARSGGQDEDTSAASPPGAASGQPSGQPTTQQPTQQRAWSQGRAGDSNLSGNDLFGSGATSAPNSAPTGASAGAPAGGPTQPPPGQWPNGAGQGAWQPPSGPQRVEEPSVPPAEAAVPPGELPEEQSDPAEAAIVATLEADVIVIDEQPRYHVVGCVALTAHEPIPIPAREAVELGFSPCGLCSPDRTLAERYPATAR